MRVPRSKHTADEMRRILEAALSLPAGMKRREGAHARLQNDLAELGDRLGYFAQTEWDIDLEWREAAGRIDVVFSDRAKGFTGPALHAFEVDYNPKRKSIEKLGELLGTRTVPWIVVFSEKPRKGAIDRVPCGIQVLVVRREGAPRSPR